MSLMVTNSLGHDILCCDILVAGRHKVMPMPGTAIRNMLRSKVTEKGTDGTGLAAGGQQSWTYCPLLRACG